MPLFRDHPVRSAVGVAIALSVAHLFSWFLNSMHAFHLTQTSVALLAIVSLMFLVTMHHRREGGLLTQSQEEMLLIGGFGLFWIALLLAWRALTYSGSSPGRAGDVATVSPQASKGRQTGFTGYTTQRPYPCSPDDLYCVVEEWTYY